MEGFNFFDDDDDDAVQVNKKLSNLSVSSYEAFKCDYGWFLPKLDNGNQSELIEIKYKADYFYVKKNFIEAIASYECYLSGCPNISLTGHRECLEGIARCHLKIKNYCISLKFAKKLDDLSSNFDSFTASLSLLNESYGKCFFYKEQILACQNLCNLHNTNSDMWLKLALAYASFYNITLPSIETLTYDNCNSQKYGEKCCCNSLNEETSLNSNNEGNIFVLLCLLHCSFHLKTVETSAVGFALTQIHISLANINIDLEHIKKVSNYGEEYLENMNIKIKEIHTGISEEKCEKAKLSTSEQVICAISEMNTKFFETKWLHFR